MKPIVLDLKASTVHWCACGGSKDQPFCDGSHIAYNKKHGTDVQPLEVSINSGKKAWCTCKGTSNQPFCDGSHAKK